MLYLRRFLLSLAFITLTTVAAFGQAASAQQSSTAVTASASADRVRFTAPAEAVRLRLQVYTEDGQVLFEGAREGGVFDWPLQDNAGARLPAGSYLAVVTVETLAGAKKQRAGVVAVEGGGVSIRAAEAGRARSAARDTDAAPLTVVAEGGAEAVTAVAHDGEDGQVTSTKGSLTFRTGDFFAGRERERMRITADGRVGVGTDAPEAALDVAGEIRARGGIRFEDGTVITSAKDFGRPDAKAAAGNTTTAVALAAGTVGTANLSGTGTANYLPKWLDNTGSLGDSVLSEANGNIVVNGGNIQLNTPASTQKSTNLLFLDNNAKTMGMVASATPTLGAANGPLFYMRGNAYSTVAGQRGMFVLGAGNVSSPTGREGSLVFNTLNDQLRMIVKPNGNVGVGTENPTAKLEVAGSLKLSGAGNGITFPDGTTLTSAGGAGGSMTGAQIVSAVNSDAAAGTISDARLSPALARLGGPNNWTGVNVFSTGLSAGGALVTDVGNPVNAGDAVNKAYTDANFVKFVPGAEQLSVGDANGTAPMINLRGGSTCCSGPGGHTPAWFKVFQNGSFVATGNLGIGVSPMQGKGYRTSWDSYKGAFRSGYADNEWDDANVGFFSWAGGSNSTAIGLYALAFGDTNQAESTSSIVFGSGNQVKGAAGFSAGAGNRVCDTYGVAFGNKAQSGGPLIDGKCDPDTFNIRGLAAVAIGYNVTADQDHTTAMGKFASNNGFTGTFIWSDGAAMQSADTFRNTANNEFALRATGGIRFRTNLGGTTGCNLPAGSGVFNCTSSRATKENFFKVDGEDVLSKLRKVEVSTWNYIAEGGQVRHMGPMAEDFYSTFRLGTNNTSIGVQDLAGVSLAAVKALDERTAELQQKTAEVEQLRARLSTLEARLAAIEQALKDKYEEGERE